MRRCWDENELWHHGIKGQKWGVRNGPPYPLDRNNKKKVDKSDIPGYNKRGKRAVDRALNRCGGLPTDSPEFSELSQQGKNIADKAVTELKRLDKPESLLDSLKNANPLLGTREGKNNCTLAAVAGHLRQRGYDVIANSTGGKGQNTIGVCEDCFILSRSDYREGSAIKFGRSKTDAAEFLVKKFGQNADGLCGIEWKNSQGIGHTFSWKIEDGKVSFFDFQQKNYNVDGYWRSIDPQGSLQVVRLDNANINKDTVFKYVSNR